MARETETIEKPGRAWRDLMHEALQPSRWEGYRAGSYEIRRQEGPTLFVEISEAECGLSRQLNLFLERIIDANRDVLAEMAAPPDEDGLLEIAWQVTHHIRADGYEPGHHRLMSEDSRKISFALTEPDVAILRLYDGLLLRVYEVNRDAVEEVFEWEAERP